MKKSKNSTFIKIGILVVIIGIYFLIEPVQTSIKKAIFILSMLDVDAVKGYILSYGVFAPIISFLLMIVQSVAAPLPAFLITFANAGLFGWVKGAILSWSSAMVGASLCFYISRYFGRDTVKKLISNSALEEVDKFFEKHGKYAILISRLLPFMSFDLVSYAAGFTSISFWSFFVATGLGQLPATIVYSYVGGMLTGGAKLFMYGILAMFTISTFVFMLKKIWKEKNS